MSPTLVEVLEESRAWGFLGPGPLQDQIDHALGFAAAAPSVPQVALDLGSGGGVPGLVLAGHWPDSRWTLLDSSERRTAFLEESVARLGWAHRVSVVRTRAEDAGRDPQLRGTVDLVVARSFAAPAPTAECGAPFLRVGGHLLVSEPPEAGPDDRWPDALAQLGLRARGVNPGPPRIAVLEQVDLCPESYPRPSGRPVKRPLF